LGGALQIDLHLRRRSPGTDDFFAQSLPTDVNVVLVLDKAEWQHVAGQLKPPDNITLVHVPAYSPELNPVEHLWFYLKERFLSHRTFDDQHAIGKPAQRYGTTSKQKPDASPPSPTTRISEGYKLTERALGNREMAGGFAP
jgi:hypothetical protein